MIAQSPSRRSPRALVGALLATLSISLTLCSLPSFAAQQSASTATSVKPKTSQAQPAKKSSRTRKAHRAAAAVSPKVATQRAQAIAADDLALKSSAALVIDEDSGEQVMAKNADVVMPIASLTKLMTALVVVDAKLPMDEVLTITSDDTDTVRNTYSRLTVGTRLTRDEMLLLALMSSENRAAMALSRNYPGGREAFIEQMNRKAQSLGMASTHFADPAGLWNQSVSTARDLHRLLGAAYAQPLIRRYSTQQDSTVRVGNRMLTFNNSNRLVRYSDDWNIELQKTGFTNEAGRCLVMQARVLSRRLAMIFLDSNGTLTRYADAARVRRHIELEARNPQRHLPGVANAAAASTS